MKAITVRHLYDAEPTTERCPACWGQGSAVCPDHPFETVRSCLDCWGGMPCPVCDGSGRCDPVPARGHSELWEWTL